MAKKRKQSDHDELPTAKREKRSITIVTQFIERFDRVYQSYHPDVLMRMISGGSKIFYVAKGGVSAWKGTALKAVAKETTEALGTQVVKEAMKETTEALGTKAVKEVAEASATKWLPGVSIAAGVGFGLYRAYCGMHLLSRGEKTRGVEEFTKAGLEVTSGVVACIPGVGTGLSLILDGGIAAWDIADTYIHQKEADKMKKEHNLILLRGDLTTIKEDIESEEYSIMEFAGCMLREIIKKFPKTDDEQKCVEFAIYLSLLVKLIRENSFFKNESAFSTENLDKEMKKIGFSKKQIRLFDGQIDADQ